MTNAELIKALRNCAATWNTIDDCNVAGCPFTGYGSMCLDTMLEAAADALEAAEKRIAGLSLDNKMLKNTIDADKGVMLDRIRFLEAQMPKEGVWESEESIDIWGDKRQVYRCSVCETINAWMSRYCPNCGARMKKGANDETDR